MSGFVYIWFDRKHKRYYVGSHWGSLNDGYICSSKWMKQAYKHRPYDFKRRIISIIQSTPIDLLEEEQRWLNMIKDHELKGLRYYNLKKYAGKHWAAIDPDNRSLREKISETTKAAMQRPEVRKKYLIGLKNRAPTSDEARKKQGESMRKNWEIRSPAELRYQPMEFGGVEYNEHMRQKALNNWQNPEIRAKRLANGNSLAKYKGITKGTKWWNDGKVNVRKTDCPGDGWKLGRIK